MIKVSEKVATAIGGLTLLLTIVGVHVNTQVEVSRLIERVDAAQHTNTRTIEVIDRLAASVDRLSVSVARLEERTGSLERERGL